MLLISTNGRKAALDMRLSAGTPRPAAPSSTPPTRSPTSGASTASAPTETPAATPPPPPGRCKSCFCDLSTPTWPGWNAYRELRDQLAARGSRPSRSGGSTRLANDAEKARLFAACRAGQVAVIVGSTPRMGVGTNIQDRAIALHHSTARGAQRISNNATAAATRS
jgi:hypothetical protein